MSRSYDLNVFQEEETDQWRIALEIYEADEYGTRKYETGVVYFPTPSEVVFLKESFPIEEYGYDYWVDTEQIGLSMLGYSEYSTRQLRAWIESLPEPEDYPIANKPNTIKHYEHYLIRVEHNSGSVSERKFQYWNDAHAHYVTAKFWNENAKFIRITEDGSEHVETY